MDDTAFQPAPPKKQPQPKAANDSILESLRGLGSGVGQTVAKDVAGKVAADAFASLFGTLPKQGELKPNQPVDIKPDRLPARPDLPVGRQERAPFPAFRRPEIQRPPVVHLEEVNLKQQIDAVRAELKALAASIKSLNQEVQKTIIEAPVVPGIYHLNFFEKLKSFLQILREQIDDSRTWLSLQNNRKKKQGYWGMYKKHGTSFGLSSERTMATQAG